MSDKSETYRFEIDETAVGLRTDKALADLCDDLSRARIQALIADGQVRVNGGVLKSASQKLELGDKIDIDIPPPEPCEPEAEDIPLDIVFEDESLLVINKPAGLVVHPGAGNQTGTLVNAVLYHCGDQLSGIGGVLRPGIVHRLDKDTSGLMLVAKTDQAHQHLSAQLADRSLSRTYQALVHGVLMPPKGTIDQPIGRHPSNRLKMAVNKRQGREAVTHYKVLQEYRGFFSLLECKLESGRTHQIRVHMAHEGYPIIGDPLYGPQATAVQAALKKADYSEDIAAELMGFPRQALHAHEIAFVHPVSEKTLDFSVSPPGDFSNILNSLSF